MPKTATINGKKVILADDATVSSTRAMLSKELGSDQFLEEDALGGKPLGESDKIKDGISIWTIPKIIKGMPSQHGESRSPGSGDQRIEQELEILKKAAGGRSELKWGPKNIGGTIYTAVLVKNVKLSTRKFKVAKTDILFLLPPRYPELPPIGCYLNWKWETIDHHFTLQSHYGAPFLGESGWYWYCVGLGGGFALESWKKSWRPGTKSDNGHNLATIFISARYAINND